MENLTAQIKTHPETNFLYLYHSVGHLEGNNLCFRLKGWYYNRDSYVRKFFFRNLLEYYRIRFQIPKNGPEYNNYMYRTKYLATDSIAGSLVSFMFVDGRSPQVYTSVTDFYGHFHIDIRVPVNVIAAEYLMTVFYGTQQINVKIKTKTPKPISIISDIDDTIKDSNVLDKIELMRNTFYRDFKVVSGMNYLYDSLKDRVNIYYISASPTQLYEPLYGFLQNYGFPYPENINLKKLKSKQPFSAANFLDNTREYKLAAIQNIITNNSGEFILVGDSGEMDPEIYNTIASQYPDRIRAIFIRMVTHEDITQRFHPQLRHKVQPYSQGGDLSGKLLPLISN